MVFFKPLLSRLRSGSFAPTVTELVIEPSAVGTTVRVTAVELLGLRRPIEQTTNPAEALQAPGELEAETNVGPAGRVSDRVTPVARAGPALVKTI